MSIDWDEELAERLEWHWRSQLRPRLDGLARACGPAEGPYAEVPMASLVLRINREALHHGAEVALVRDLFRWQPRQA